MGIVPRQVWRPHPHLGSGGRRARSWRAGIPEARALAGCIPDCLVLMKRLLADLRVPRPRKLWLVGLVGYLALPFDLVPDFIRAGNARPSP